LLSFCLHAIIANISYDRPTTILVFSDLID